MVRPQRIRKNHNEYTLRLNRELITDEKLSCFAEGQSKKIFERKLNNDKGDYSYKYNRGNGVTAEIAPKARKNISLILTIIQLMNNNKLKKLYTWFENFMKPVSI